ncbi:haloacid dehalogenase-like hydrolase [Microbacterium esteraromaticum]|uniref:Haloacid dehalogenase-like hydrolase n=1 Tax=Microbacterium esteraromaticum TaxID=57043 RepID=A0A7D7WA41_9MICO|nr:HAD family hydrolase [Microbacterium esteraromaticum]QMU97235.1 haloacid dehalogenase-like hydrolase [Microbacterium esteraromaticum]
MTIAFDLDGVLSRSDTMAAVVSARLRSRPWLACPIAILAAVAALAPAHGRLRPRCNRAIVHIALAGLQEHEYRHLVRSVARRLASRPGNTSPWIIEALRRAHRDGSAIVTTATERHLATEYLRLIGIEGLPIQASEFRFQRQGPRFARHNVGDAKSTALRASRAQAGLERLYTDSASDLPLARLSTSTVLVEPSRRSLRAFEGSGLSFMTARWTAR